MSSPEDLLRDNQVLIPLCTVAKEAYSHPSVSSLMGALSVKPWAPFTWIQLTRVSNTSLVIYHAHQGYFLGYLLFPVLRREHPVAEASNGLDLCYRLDQRESYAFEGCYRLPPGLLWALYIRSRALGSPSQLQDLR